MSSGICNRSGLEDDTHCLYQEDVAGRRCTRRIYQLAESDSFSAVVPYRQRYEPVEHVPLMSSVQLLAAPVGVELFERFKCSYGIKDGVNNKLTLFDIDQRHLRDSVASRVSSVPELGIQ